MSRLIAFWSPTGAGATTLLLNTAAALSARRESVAAVDLNLTVPSLALYADVLPHNRPQSACLSRLLPALAGGWLSREDLAQSFLPGPGFNVLPGLLDAVAASRVTEEDVQRLMQLVGARFDYVLADLTPALDSVACLPLLELADLVVLVVGPEIASRFHTRRALLPLQGSGLSQRLFPVLNRAAGSLAAQVAGDIELPVTLTIPALRQMPGWIESGKIAYQVQPASGALTRFRTAIDSLATAISQVAEKAV
jgi:MinD-like ATPase involved in chromosome partitioning or flagellar assembly